MLHLIYKAGDLIGDVVPNIIYNSSPAYDYSQTTILLWVNQANQNTSNLINPLFSLYNNDLITNQQNPGFYVTPVRNLLGFIFTRRWC